MNGLFDLTIIGFVVTPMVFMITLLVGISWVRTRGRYIDRPGLLLAGAVRRMPDERRDWGAAMMAELSHIQGWHSRWRFALGCSRVALFPSSRRYLAHTLTRQDPLCGVLSVALPPFGLPFLYLVAVIIEALAKQQGVSTSELLPGITRAAVLLTVACMMAGLPFGIAGILRGERMRWISALGVLSSLGIIGYFIVVMQFLAGGPNGD